MAGVNAPSLHSALTSRRLCSITPPLHTHACWHGKICVCSACVFLAILIECVPCMCQCWAPAAVSTLLNAHSATRMRRLGGLHAPTEEWSLTMANKQTNMQLRDAEWQLSSSGKKRRGLVVRHDCQAQELAVIRLPFRPRCSFICVLNVSV